MLLNVNYLNYNGLKRDTIHRTKNCRLFIMNIEVEAVVSKISQPEVYIRRMWFKIPAIIEDAITSWSFRK